MRAATDSSRRILFPALLALSACSHGKAETESLTIPQGPCRSGGHSTNMHSAGISPLPKDDRTDSVQARRLAEEIASHGGKSRVIVYPEYGHNIPVEVRDKEIDPFIEAAFGK